MAPCNYFRPAFRQDVAMREVSSRRRTASGRAPREVISTRRAGPEAVRLRLLRCARPSRVAARALTRGLFLGPQTIQPLLPLAAGGFDHAVIDPPVAD